MTDEEKQSISYEDVIKAIDDFEREEPVNINPNVVIPYYVLDNMGAKLSRAITELEKKDKIIDEMAKVLADYKYEEIICMEVDCEHIELQNEGTCIGDKACIKEYFKKKVGTEEK